MAKEKPRKRVTDLKVHEISFVDNPAVPKAKFLIVKRHDVEGGDTMKIEDFEAEIQAAAKAVEKSGDELIKATEDAMKDARKAITSLMNRRSDLPGFFRRMVMEMDLAIDEFLRSRADLLRRVEAAEGEDVTPEDTAKREDEKKPEEKPEEKRGPEEEEEEEEKAGHKEEKQVKPTDGKCPEGMRLDEEKGICIPIPPKAKKVEDRDCPPGMVFDDAKGKCVPKKEKSEKKEDGEPAPRGDGKVGATLELSSAQQKRVNKLLAKYEKK